MNFSKTSGNPQGDNKKVSPWWGPFDLLGAREQLKKVHVEFENVCGYELGISNKEILSKSDEYVLEQEIEKHCKTSFLRGLIQFGIVEEKDLYYPDEEGKIPRIRISSSDSTGIVWDKMTPVIAEEPEQWAEEITSSAKKILDCCKTMMENYCLLLKIEINIGKYGGWNKFLKDYRELVAKDLTKG